ncbi:MAG TPA: hypothetical protein VFV47_01860 [Hyphomicrobiaceae bacterium]|nr:hypothetical protein [Hyphomicrobiaceae bacterium]
MLISSRSYRRWRFAPLAALLLLGPEPARAEMTGESRPTASHDFESYRRGFADGFRARQSDRSAPRWSGRERWSGYPDRFPRYGRQDRYGYAPYWWRRTPHPPSDRNAMPPWSRYDGNRSWSYRNNRPPALPLVERWYGDRGWASYTERSAR